MEEVIEGIIKKNLPDASEHLQAALKKELEKLDFAELIFLVYNIATIKRICKIIEINDKIKEAKENGTYDEAEHMANEIDLEIDED